MAVRVISMQVKLAVALARFSQGERLDVRATCREVGISPPTFYKYASRFAESGVDGLFERSRRPHSSPSQLPAVVEDRIVWWRKTLGDDGWDNGGQSIYFRMVRAGEPAPSVRTIHRVLVRRGLVEPAPGKRPRASYKSFTFARTNDCWQCDATECKLADGTAAVVFHLLDDASRKALNSTAAQAETAAAAVNCVSGAISRFGIPAMFLSDNGSAFSAKLRGGEGELERMLRALGVNVVTSSPYHPQTNGKVERYHQTFKRWLGAHDAPGNIAELQALADTFDDLYGSERPHSSLSGLTPNEVWATRDRAPQPSGPADPTTRTSTVTVSGRGAVRVASFDVQIGREWVGTTVTVILTGDHAAIFHGRTHVRSLVLDRTRRYQANGRPRGRQRPRIVSTMS
jgi:transposase InsO family protein